MDLVKNLVTLGRASREASKNKSTSTNTKSISRW